MLHSTLDYWTHRYNKVKSLFYVETLTTVRRVTIVSNESITKCKHDTDVRLKQIAFCLPLQIFMQQYVKISTPAFLLSATSHVYPFQKLMTIIILITGTVSMAVFVAELEYWLPRSMPVVWISVILGVMCLTGKSNKTLNASIRH